MGPIARTCAILALVALAGCQTAKGSLCLSKPFRPSEQTRAAMSDAEVKDALEHNRLGQRLCGWKP
jgi:hypothetical protein